MPAAPGPADPALDWRASETPSVVSLLLSVTFACGLVVAVSHVINRRFVAPAYDVVANLTAFSCAAAASLLLHHWIPTLFSAIAILCWLMLARRTFLARRTETDSARSNLDSHRHRE